MSEQVSAGASPSAGGASPSAPSTSQQTSGQGYGSGQGQASQTQGQTNQGEAQASAPERVLAEQDLDAYIEYTINGRKEKIKVRDALKGYGLDKTANQRMQEAAGERKRAQKLMHLMTTDFDKWCEVTGTDRDAFLRSNLQKRKDIAEEILAQEYELQQMDPNQRKAMELEQQLKSMQQRELQTKQPLIDQIKEIVSADRLPKGLENATEAQLRGYLAEQQQHFSQGLDTLSNELLESWQKAGLPKEKDFGAWMAQLMLDHQKKSIQHKKRTGEDLPPLHPDQAAVKVKERFLNSTRSLFSQMDAPAIHEALGEAIIQKLRDHDMGLASQSSGPRFNDQNRPAEAASGPKKYLNQTEWRKAMGLS
jgi:hypothetical protein